MLRLVEQVAKARLAKEVAELGLESAERHEDSTRERYLRASEDRSPESVRETERLQGQLHAAEAETRRRRAEYQRHRAERGRLEAEIQHLAGYL